LGQGLATFYGLVAFFKAQLMTTACLGSCDGAKRAQVEPAAMQLVTKATPKLVKHNYKAS